MTRLFSHKDRPVHLGPYPLEKLQRIHKPASLPAGEPAALAIEDPARTASLANAMVEYVNVMDRMRDGPVAPNKAPIPDLSLIHISEPTRH